MAWLDYNGLSHFLDKLKAIVVTISEQTLTQAQQTQVRTNIGAADALGLSKLSDMHPDNAGAHNSLYRGKNLGTITSANIDEFVSEHEIAEGKFTDLYIGDYVVIQDGTYNKEWMVAGFDMDFGYYKSSTAKIDIHEVTMIPRGAGLLTGRMHSSNSTSGGIVNSEICTTLGTIKNNLVNALGTHLGEQAGYLSTAINSDGTATGVSTGTDSTPRLLKPIEIFGYFNKDDLTTGGSGLRKLPVFDFVSQNAFDPGKEFWIDFAYNATQFGCTRLGGFALYRANASNTDNWIRPKIAIK